MVGRQEEERVVRVGPQRRGREAEEGEEEGLEKRDLSSIERDFGREAGEEEKEVKGEEEEERGGWEEVGGVEGGEEGGEEVNEEEKVFGMNSDWERFFFVPPPSFSNFSICSFSESGCSSFSPEKKMEVKKRDTTFLSGVWS